MSSVEIIPSIVLVIAAGVLGHIFLCYQNLFVGIGGKLGTIAFGGVVIITLINGLS
jgi:hypothetical protein